MKAMKKLIKQEVESVLTGNMGYELTNKEVKEIVKESTNNIMRTINDEINKAFTAGYKSGFEDLREQISDY